MLFYIPGGAGFLPSTVGISSYGYGHIPFSFASLSSVKRGCLSIIYINLFNTLGINHLLRMVMKPKYYADWEYDWMPRIIGLGYSIFASTLTHNIIWSQCFPFQNIQSPWNPTKINSPIDSPWSVGWKLMDVWIQDMSRTPSYGLLNRLGNYFFWVLPSCSVLGMFPSWRFQPVWKICSSNWILSQGSGWK